MDDEYFCVLTCGNRSRFDAKECPYYSLSKDYSSRCDTIYAKDGLCSVILNSKIDELGCE